MPRNVYPFTTKDEVVRFARIFVRRRVVKGFVKDIDKCLGGGRKAPKAFMPGLMYTISLIDLLSGLYSGKVGKHGADGHSYTEFNDFIQAMMPGRYDPYDLRVLYIGLRHKLAHLSHPYFVLNTDKPGSRLRQRSMLLSWDISSDAHEPPIRIEKKRSRLVRRQPVPWRTRVDHVVHVSIRTLADDAIKMSRAYVRTLESDPHRWEKFRDCMSEFYQT